MMGCVGRTGGGQHDGTLIGDGSPYGSGRSHLDSAVRNPNHPGLAARPRGGAIDRQGAPRRIPRVDPRPAFGVTELDALRLPISVFDEVRSGPVSTAGITTLRKSQYSLRRLRLRTLLEVTPEIRSRLGPFGDLEHAWAVLAEAERRDPATVEDILMTPSVGGWLGRALRLAIASPREAMSFPGEVGW